MVIEWVYEHYIGFRIELQFRRTGCKDKLFEKNPGIYLKLCKKKSKRFEVAISDQYQVGC